MSREMVGWLLAASGGLCAIIAAGIQGGWVAAFGAAGPIFTAAAGTFGYLNKAPAAPAPTTPPAK